MEEEKNKAIMNCGDDYDDILDIQYGRKGTPSRDRFDREAEAFILAERLKEERRKAGLTQEQLAAKIGTKKSYISRIENGKTDVQLSTLFKIFQGLGKRVSITINDLRLGIFHRGINENGLTAKDIVGDRNECLLLSTAGPAFGRRDPLLLLLRLRRSPRLRRRR